MYQKPKKRSVLINGHRTSLSLEDIFWHKLCNISQKQDISINKLITNKMLKINIYNVKFLLNYIKTT